MMPGQTRPCLSFPTQVQDFLLKSFAEGTEGLMLKRLDAGSTYQPSKRSESWIKIKRCANLTFET